MSGKPGAYICFVVAWLGLGTHMLPLLMSAIIVDRAGPPGWVPMEDGTIFMSLHMI